MRIGIVGIGAETGLGAVDLGGLEAAWLAGTMADARQAIMASPAGWRQALVFADLAARPS
jgi:8-hydroxy-5-deazaflavin:NADPH oxidoreductase